MSVKTRNMGGAFLTANAQSNGATPVTTALGVNPFSRPGTLSRLTVVMATEGTGGTHTKATVAVRKNGTTIFTGTGAGEYTNSLGTAPAVLEFVAGRVKRIDKGWDVDTALTSIAVAVGDRFDFTLVLDGTQVTAASISVAMAIDATGV